MKNKPKPRIRQTPKPALLTQFVNPRYISLTGKHDPLINRYVKRILKAFS